MASRCASVKRLGTPERCYLTEGHDGEHENQARDQHWTGTRLSCPDGGYCHHGCETGCFRVAHAGPLSIAKFPGDTWPDAIKASYGEPTGFVF